MSSKQCNKCTSNIGTNKPGLQCDGFCKLFYHAKCVNISAKQLAVLNEGAEAGVSWLCDSCRTTGNNDCPGQSEGKLNTQTQDALLNTLLDLKSEIRAVRTEQAELLTSVQFCSDKISDFEAKLLKIDEYMSKTDHLAIENSNLKKDISMLNYKLSEIEQFSRINNVEIQGVPVKQNENIINIIQQIGDYIGVNIEQNKIEFAHRVNTSTNVHKNIVVKFTTRHDKDCFLSASKTKRLTTRNNSQGLNVPNISVSLYINEHLTQTNKILYKEVRTAAKTKNYKFVWIKNGNIFVRKNETSRITHIKNSEQINNL